MDFGGVYGIRSDRDSTIPVPAYGNQGRPRIFSTTRWNIALREASALCYSSWWPGELQVVDEFPVQIDSDDGQITVLSCSEVLLTEDHVQKMLGRGVISVLSFVNQACLRWPRQCNVGNHAGIIRDENGHRV